MQKLKAYMLLLVLLVSWAERFLLLEETYYVEVKPAMSPLEQTIAGHLGEEYGVKGIVKVTPMPYMPLRGIAYRDQAFSISLGGQLYYYTLIDEAQSVSYKQITKSKPVSSEEQERDALVIKKITSEHYASSLRLWQEPTSHKQPSTAYAATRVADVSLPVDVPPPQG
ncbi:MAG: hypothetical protein EAZ89_08435 [Bacteroidetes bacterium]|jgi:hypothetical protein|nr:MAG: hypothetical protein EAZ89_08435 [Bacteroidota bacterium]